MARPRMCRRVGRIPDCVLFKPAGIPTRVLQEITLTVDELESLRLADLEGLYHQEAAQRMGVSRQTFGRIVTEARQKVARVLVQGWVLRIEGGSVDTSASRSVRCLVCQHEWRVGAENEPPRGCPECRGNQLDLVHCPS
jgi:predicted DNA-binding protein (UPF0251 family)